MPYKDKEAASEASRERMRRYREKQGVTKGVTSEGVTGQGVTYPDDQAELAQRGLRWCDILPGDRVRRPWFVDCVGWTIQVDPRYHTLTDGQVMDRASLPHARYCPGMAAVLRARAQPRKAGPSPQQVQRFKDRYGLKV